MEQLPKLLRSNDLNAEPADLPEEQQAEPISEYLGYVANSSVLLDGSWSIDPTITHGVLVLGFSELGEHGKPFDVLRAAVISVRSHDGIELFALDPVLRERYSARTHRVRWVRLDAAPATSARELFARLAAEDPRRGKIDAIPTKGGLLEIRAAVFPEEVGYRQVGTGWAFAVEYSSEPKKGKRLVQPYFARVFRASRSDVLLRAPELQATTTKAVAVFGLGCVGAPSAIEFARAGVAKLRVLDGDFIDAGTILRWPFGLGVVGRPKADLLERFIRDQYPYTEVKGEVHTLGWTRDVASEGDDTVLARMLEDVSLIYDATAEFGVQFMLSELARQRRIPYVGVAGRQGGWGGYVMRITPDVADGCWSCLQHSWDDTIPAPPSSPDAFVQPGGCGSPTFLAAGFDMTQIATYGVRVAVGELARGVDGGYPPSPWDVLVLRFRDSHGKLIAPLAEGYSLKRHPDCPNCGD